MKNIIIEIQDGASRWVRSGYAKVLSTIGFNVILWDKNQISTFDIFNQFKDISLFICNTASVDRAVIKCINNHPETKIALFASAWGSNVDSLDRKEYPIDYVTEQEKRNIQEIQKRINCVFIHITEKGLEGSLGGWKSELGLPIMGLLNGADLFSYYKATPSYKYFCDVGFVGGYWEYKAKTLDKYMVRLCREQWQNIDIKIFGMGWGVNNYLGSLADGEDAKLFASAKICPNISEKHSYKIQDLIERIYKCPCAGGFLICDNVDLTETNLTDCVPQFSSYEEFLNLIEYYLDENHENERKSLLEKQKSIVTLGHSYFERMFKLLKFIGFEEEGKRVIRKKKELFGLDSIYNGELS